MANTLKQLAPLVAMNLKTVPQRLGSSSVIVIGIAGVVAVLVSILAIAVGFRHTLASTGRPDRAIILRGGSDAELNSVMTPDEYTAIVSMPGIRKSPDGKPIASREIVNVTNLPKLDTDTPANVTLRGVGLDFAELEPSLRIVQGRMFRPAVRELIAGIGAAKQFKGLTVGNVLHFRDADWTVTGLFTSGGDIHESELIADVDTVGSSLEYGSAFSSVVALLDSAGGFGKFKDALTTDPRLKVDVQREPDYYASQSKQLSDLIDKFGRIVGVIMGIGALFGALNSMYSAVGSRVQEIATLRAIGFNATPVLLSVLIETLLLSLIGGVIGAALAWFFFNGHSTSTLGSTFSQVVFQLRVTPSLLSLGVIWACAIGMIGGLFPALRAARLPVAEALRAG